MGDLTPSQIVAELAGYGPRDDCENHAGPCWVCAGRMTRGQPVGKWSGSSFTGQSRVRCPDATHVCEACVWICSIMTPVPGRPVKIGKKRGGNFRNYSHLWEDNWDSPSFGDNNSQLAGYANASKGEKPTMRAFLAREHEGEWFAAIADSGQKHMLPWAPMNGTGRSGVVLFDETLVQIPDDQSLVVEITDLLTAGATKEEIGTGEYTPRAYRLAAEQVLAFEARRSGERHSSWWTLALWLAQRDEEQVQRRMAAEKEARDSGKRKGRGKKRAAQEPHGGGSTCAAGGLSGNVAGERAEALGAADDTPPEQREDVREPGGVGDDDGAKARDRQPEQASLPGLE